MDRLESQTSQSPSGLFSIWGRYSKEATFVPEPLKPLSEEGYAKLAWLMARTDTSNLAIFKKFGQLNMFNLLRLQGELMQLQEDFCEAYNDSDYTKHRYSLKELRKSVPSEARSFNLPGSAEGSIAPNEIGVAPGLSPSNEQFRPQRPSAPPGPSASGSNTLNGSINPNLPYIPSEPYPPNGPYTPLEPDTSNPPVKHNEEADEDETYNSDDGSLYNPNYLHLLSKRIQKKLKEYSKRVYHYTQGQLTREIRRSALASLPARKYGDPTPGKS
jgi:hypothetical protein